MSCVDIASQVALVVMKLSANAGDARILCLIPGQEDSLEEDMAIPSSILAWRYNLAFIN